jgi:hypothetical protein
LVPSAHLCGTRGQALQTNAANAEHLLLALVVALPGANNSACKEAATMITDTGVHTIEDSHSAVSWKAIFAGATGSIAVTMILVAFGVGVGFTVISPWSGQGVSATTFTVAAGIYLFVVAMLSSTIGGYLAGRLRSRWHSVNEHERYFRDSAHGFVVWAVATIVTAAVLGGAVSSLVGGAASTVAPAATAAAASSPSDIYVDALLRTDPAQGTATAPTPGAATQQATSPTAGDQTAAPLQGGQLAAPQRQNVGNRAEITRILAPSMLKGGAVSDADKKYLTRIVAARSPTRPARRPRCSVCGWRPRCWPARFRRLSPRSKAATCVTANGTSRTAPAPASSRPNNRQHRS